MRSAKELPAWDRKTKVMKPGGFQMKIFKLRIVAATLIVGLCSLSLNASAQNSDADDSEIDEIVVTGQFIAETGQSALKSDVPLRDVPFTVAGYTREFMDAIETTRIADLYNYMAGVQKSGPTGYDVSIRGYRSTANDRNVLLTDGLPGLSVRFGSPPTVNAERIEVVKGPAAVLYGQIQPGGFINIVTKRPEETRSTGVRFRADGTYGADASIGDTTGFIASVDTTGPLTDDGRFLYRLIAEYEDANTYRDNGFSDSFYIVPSLTWVVSDRTRATVFAEYRDEDHALDNYLVAFGNDISNAADLTTRYQEPNDEQPETGWVGGLEIDHAFSDTFSWKLNYRYVWHEDFARGYENSSFRDEDTLRRRDRNQANERTYDFVDTSLNWQLQGGGIEHDLSFGLNVGKETSQFTRINFDNGNPTLDIDVLNPVYGQGVPNADRNVSDNDRFRDFDSVAVYFRDFVTLSENWKAVIGARYEEFDTSEIEYRPAFPTPVFFRGREANGDDVSTMLGLVYQPDDRWSIYASYAESFDPPTWGREDSNGNPITKPERGQQLEAGVKMDFDRGTATVSVFSITRDDVAQDTGQDQPDGTAIFDFIGEDKSDGFEVEVDTAINENWNLIFAWANVTAEVEADVNSNRIGQTLLGAPENTVSIWNRFQINEAWGVGVGINHAGDRYGSAFASSGDQSTRLELPDYTLVDLGIYYTGDAFDATVKFSNITDEEYYVSSTRNTNIVPGVPATVTFSLFKQFD